MFGRLDRFAGRMKAAGRPTGGRGKGKITKARMKKWSAHYRNAISENVGDVTAMRNRVWAILYHSQSTAESLQHQYGPEGSDSWCFHQ